jgi:hypothetical protein
LDDHEIQKEWEAALEDAGLPLADCSLVMTDAPPTDSGVGAQWCEPGMAMTAGTYLVDDELAAELNAPGHINLHRILVRRPLGSDPIMAARISAKLRHELEHALQWRACGPPVFQLSQVADHVLALKLRGLPRGRVFTNLKPIEQDANAASAMFVRRRWPDAVAVLLKDPDDAPLVRSLTPPGSPQTLVTRMIAFLYLYEDLCATLAAPWAWTFAEFLENDIAPGAGVLWRALEATAGTFEYWPPGGAELGSR